MHFFKLKTALFSSFAPSVFTHCWHNSSVLSNQWVSTKDRDTVSRLHAFQIQKTNKTPNRRSSPLTYTESDSGLSWRLARVYSMSSHGTIASRFPFPPPLSRAGLAVPAPQCGRSTTCSPPLPSQLCCFLCWGGGEGGEQSSNSRSTLEWSFCRELMAEYRNANDGQRKESNRSNKNLTAPQ